VYFFAVRAVIFCGTASITISEEIAEEEEIKWFSKADLSKYIGKYVAIVGNRVVTSGENAKEVWKTAKAKYPDKTPSLAKVPKEELLIL